MFSKTKRYLCGMMAFIMLFCLTAPPMALAADGDTKNVKLEFVWGGWNEAKDAYSVSITAVTDDGQPFKASSIQVSVMFDTATQQYSGIMKGEVPSAPDPYDPNGTVAMAFSATKTANGNRDGKVKCTYNHSGDVTSTVESGTTLATITFKPVGEGGSASVSMLNETGFTSQIGYADENSKVQPHNLTIADPITVPPVEVHTLTKVDPETTEATAPGSVTYKALDADNNDVTSLVTWTVAPKDEGLTGEGVTVEGNIVKVAEGAAPGNYAVTATSSDASKLTGGPLTATLTVKIGRDTFNLTVETPAHSDTTTFKKGGSITVTAPAVYNDDDFREWKYPADAILTSSVIENGIVTGTFTMPGSDVTIAPYYVHTEGCYVATAVYGSYDCPEVWVLRRFRDKVLAKTWYGRLFIKLYYAVSPTVVRVFGGMDWFQNFWRGRLDKMVSNLQSQGFASSPYQDRVW